MLAATLPMTPRAVSQSRPNWELEELAKKLQSREEGALEAVIQRTESACYRLALSILGDPDLAKDALQDAYLLVYQRVGQLRDPSAFKSWLYRIVQHCCHDIHRRRRQEVETDFTQRQEQETTGQSHERDLAEDVSRQHKIRATFEKLPEIDRTAIALREVAALSYEEMSRVLDIPLGTVRSRLAKARKRFIDLYKGASAR